MRSVLEKYPREGFSPPDLTGIIFAAFLRENANPPAGTDPGSPSGRVYVFKIGNYYVVSDTARRTGELDLLMTLSKSYKVLAQYR